MARWNPRESAAARPFARLVGALAYAYPLTLLAVWLAFTTIGERHWTTAGLLYAPRALFAVPLVLLAPALWLTGQRRQLWTQLAALLVWLFPLMGLVLPGPARGPKPPSLRVLSYNVDMGNAGADKILSVVDQLAPDLVLFQESPWEGELHDGLRARFPYFDHTAQFVTASRYPILERTPPPRPPDAGTRYLQRSMRYLIDSNLGKLAVYSVHPVSPRGTVRSEHVWSLLRGQAPGPDSTGNPETHLSRNAAMREEQLAAAVTRARLEPHPVLLAGDTNLPGASRALRVYFGDYRDGFERASSGLGYTFPAERPFLRLDRIFADRRLEFSEFRVGCPDASDHCWVWAELFRP